ncbi:MAG TPA: ABC transporter ATP-binding protein [Opitutaceae bacterium]|nr:ABC transporter ATP-binding protein [Opitutaceae bacterium]
MSAPAPENTIEVRNLVKAYAGVTAVNGVSFSVRRGEVIGFLGPNGAGKSTTMRILTGFLPATSGYVSVCGVPVASRPEDVKRHIGYMPENNPLPEDVRVSEYLAFRGRLKELSGKRLRTRIDTVVELCDLKRVRHRIIGKLSKGTRQRVGIAEAILAEPDLLIMDEPTIGLDPHQIIMIRDLIVGLRGRMSVIISSHILPEIEATCDRVIIINQGRVVAAGSPDDLRREFLGRANYRVEIAGEIDTLRATLDALHPGLALDVVDVADAAGFATYEITSANSADLGEQLVRELANTSGLRLRSCARTEASLEHVFLAATRRSWDATLEDKKPGGRTT